MPVVVGAGPGPGGGAGDVARVEEAEATCHVAAVGDKGDVHFGWLVEVLLGVEVSKRWVLLLALCGHALPGPSFHLGAQIQCFVSQRAAPKLLFLRSSGLSIFGRAEK